MLNQVQAIILVCFALFSLVGFISGIKQTTFKKRAYRQTFIFNLVGAFVWADTVIFGPFWALVSLFCLLTKDWLLFLLIISVFWAVRSLGEIVYWLNQQFSGFNRNPPENFRLYPLFKNDSIWFIYQIFWQCVLVITIITSLYLAHLWLKTV